MRPAGSSAGPLHADLRSVAVHRVRMETFDTELLMDRIPGIDAIRRAGDQETDPQPPIAVRTMAAADFSDRQRPSGVPAFKVDAARPTRNCLSCHTTSSDGRYLAVSSQEDEVVPAGFVATQGVLHVIRKKDGQVLHKLPGAVFPRFHPSVSGRFAYSATGASFTVKQRLSIYRADIVVQDAESAVQSKALPGADDPERCEIFPDWSPDGQTLVFARAARRQPCDGSRGHLELALVPYAGGAGGEARPLPGASNNGLSNAQPRFSPDGRWIIFHAADRGFFSRGTADLYIVPAAGGQARKLSVSTPAMETWHAFSPDGHWLAFLSNRDRVDQPRIYLTALDKDGRSSPAIPLPGASEPGVHIHTFDWGP